MRQTSEASDPPLNPAAPPGTTPASLLRSGPDRTGRCRRYRYIEDETEASSIPTNLSLGTEDGRRTEKSSDSRGPPKSSIVPSDHSPLTSCGDNITVRYCLRQPTQGRPKPVGSSPRLARWRYTTVAAARSTMRCSLRTGSVWDPARTTGSSKRIGTHVSAPWRLTTVLRLSPSRFRLLQSIGCVRKRRG